MLTADMILAMLLWPALVSGAVLSLLWIPSMRSPGRAEVIAALAVASGFAVGFWVVAGRPSLPPPVDAKEQLPWIAAAAFIVAGLIRLVQKRHIAVAVLCVALAALSMRLLMRAPIQFQWSATESVARVAVLAAGMAATIGAGLLFQARAPAKLSALAIAALAGLSAPIMLFSDSLLLAQLNATLGIAVGVLLIAVLLVRFPIPLGAAAVVSVAVSWSFWVVALRFASMPIWSFALLVLALPLALVVGLVIPKQFARTQLIAPTGVVLSIVVAAVAVGGLRYARSSEPAPASAQTDYGYGYDYDGQ